MAHTNLGLNLLEREHVVEGGEEDEEKAQQRMRATLSEAIEHFEKALTWRSFERDPGDWAYTQINLALAYSRRGGDDGHADLWKAIDHGDEAIRGFRAAGQASHRAQALGNRATAQSNLALLPETDPAAREALLGAAEHDARTAIAAVGEEAHGVEAGRRWWQLGLVLSAREQYTPDLIATVRRALQELTPESAPRDCREAGRRLAVVAVEDGDWAVAAEMWEQAARGAAAATESRATRGGRFAEIARNGNVFRWAAWSCR